MNGQPLQLYYSLSGDPVKITPMYTILSLNNIQYFINTPLSVYNSEKTKKSSNLQLFTYFLVREDTQSLYGFLTSEERDIFALFLHKINGVGAKTALAILSTFSTSDLSSIVQKNDVKLFCKVPGIGAKTAEKILFELKDKFPKNISPSPSTFVANEAVLVLESLGLSSSQAKQRVEEVLKKNPEHTDVSKIVQEALK